jgi:AbiTii
LTLLSELIDAASGDDAPVSTLLRKVKVIAARMHTGELAAWVEHELVGYPADATLPEYRGPFRAEVLGHFSGPFGSRLENAPVPPIGFPEKFREGALFNIEYRQPIAELEQLAQTKKELHADWPADAVALTNSMIQAGTVHLYEHMGLQQARRRISPTALKAIVDTVRTRILDLALYLEGVVPEAGQPDATPPSKEQVQQIVTNVYGGTPNIAVASSDFEQSMTFPSPGDEPALLRFLDEIGIERDELAQLESALEEDRSTGEDESGKRMGPRVSAWLGRVTVRTATAATTGAAGAVGGLAAKALAAHFGLR